MMVPLLTICNIISLCAIKKTGKTTARKSPTYQLVGNAYALVYNADVERESVFVLPKQLFQKINPLTLPCGQELLQLIVV